MQFYIKEHSHARAGATFTDRHDFGFPVGEIPCRDYAK